MENEKYELEQINFSLKFLVLPPEEWAIFTIFSNPISKSWTDTNVGLPITIPNLQSFHTNAWSWFPLFSFPSWVLLFSHFYTLPSSLKFLNCVFFFFFLFFLILRTNVVDEATSPQLRWQTSQKRQGWNHGYWLFLKKIWAHCFSF